MIVQPNGNALLPGYIKGNHFRGYTFVNSGGTTTVTNLGMFGVQSFAAIINPPQSSILAVGAVHRAPVVKKGKLAVGSVMEVTLSVDHRAVDGSTAAEWMRAFVTTIQHPTQILL